MITILIAIRFSEFETLPHSSQGKDHYPNHHWVQVTGTVPETKDVINHDPNRQVRGTVTKLETLLQTNHMSHPDPDPDRDPVQVRGTVTNLETLPQANHISHPDPDRDPVQVRGTVTN